LWAAQGLPSLAGTPAQTRLAAPRSCTCRPRLEPIFCVLQQSRSPGKFRFFTIALVSEPIPGVAAGTSHKPLLREITDDSDGLVEAIADSTTEITDDSNGREVAIANTTTAGDVAGSAFGMEFMNGSRTTHQGKPLTQVVNEAIEAYLKNLSRRAILDWRCQNPKSNGSTATTRSPLSCKTRKFC